MVRQTLRMGDRVFAGGIYTTPEQTASGYQLCPTSSTTPSVWQTPKLQELRTDKRGKDSSRDEAAGEMRAGSARRCRRSARR